MTRLTDEALQQRRAHLVQLRGRIERNQSHIQSQIDLHAQELENSQAVVSILTEQIEYIVQEQNNRAGAVALAAVEEPHL